MRVNVKKYLIMGPESVRDACFKRIQELGIVEFIRKTPTSLETPAEIQNFINALHVLRQMVPVKQEYAEDYRSANVLAQHVVERGHELEKLREQARLTEHEIARVEVFGDFSIHDLHEIEQQSRRVIQFYFCKEEKGIHALEHPKLIFVGHAYGLDYFVAINKERTQYDGLIEMNIDHSLGELKHELAEFNRQINVYETELAHLAHKKKLLKQGLINTLNRYNLEDSKARIEPVLDGEAFAVESWVPKNKVRDLYALASELNLYVAPIAVEKQDRVPTQLENRGAARLGEDLIAIYDTPSKTDRDPSLWVFIAFGIFFSMIIADAGYGLILLAISLWLYFRFGRKKGGFVKRFTLLCISLSIGCIIWGVLLTSYFGLEFAPDSKIRNVSLINWMIEQKAKYFLKEKPHSYAQLIEEYPQLKGAKTPKELLMTVTSEQQGVGKYTVYNTFQGNVLLELVIFIGTIHIMLSFLRYVDKNWAGLGWAIFMVGAYLYFPSILDAVSLIHYIFHIPYASGALVGKYLVYIGLGLAVLLAIIQRRVAGLAEIMHVIQVFADVMSYLRIYALALAGMIMATTFNQIASRAPLVVGILLILAGHTLNFTLAIMGGVIHGLRLNFIEWYHYSFEGGGKKFNPLTLLKID
jgi:V/A-type H+/Na+-transporting ATPase subunit I